MQLKREILWCNGEHSDLWIHGRIVIKNKYYLTQNEEIIRHRTNKTCTASICGKLQKSGKRDNKYVNKCELFCAHELEDSVWLRC